MSEIIGLPLSHQDILSWHPRLNVYVLDNQDVLLLSPTLQLLLCSAQFPLLSLVNGQKSAEQILRTADIQPHGAWFFHQINQLYHANLLITTATPASYMSALFERVDVNGIDYRNLTDACRMVNLSALPAQAIADVAVMLVDAVQTINASSKIVQSLSVIVVDDFIDPRIARLSLQGHFMVIKISGEDIWLSPLFKTNEMAIFVGLQQRILANQPVRKWLMTRWPQRHHSFTFVVRQSLHDNLSRILARLFIEQIQFNTPRQLLVYHTIDERVEYHAIASNSPNNSADDDFATRITAPIRLQSCIGRFNQDGGSRSITAKRTVDRLMPLVSSVTGVISHLEVLEYSHDKSVKIYQTGYFKPNNQMSSEDFEQHGFIQICLGKGVSHEQSKASALAEAIERYCALYQTDIPLLKSSGSALHNAGRRVLNFQDLVPYSEQQYQCFNDSSHPDFRLKEAVKPYDDSAIHWLPCWSLTHNESIYLPLSLCFGNTPFDDEQFGRWHSNGCAAGNTLEEAILQALFELIERDATGIWWYNQVTCPLFDLSRLDQEHLDKLTQTLAPTDVSEAQAHDFWVLDVTNDIGIPVMVAIGKNKSTGGWVMGFGCHLIPELAAQRALTELCQLMPIRNQDSASFDFEAIVEGAYLYGDSDKKTLPYLITDSEDIKQDIFNIVTALDTLGFETVALDYSRSHIPLNTAKVFVPGLSHIWPQLANQRLYQLPVQLGWLKQAKSPATINQQSLTV